MLARVSWMVPTVAALTSAVLIVATMPILPAEVASKWNNDGPTSTMSPWGFLALPAIGVAFLVAVAIYHRLTGKVLSEE